MVESEELSEGEKPSSLMSKGGQIGILKCRSMSVNLAMHDDITSSGIAQSTVLVLYVVRPCMTRRSQRIQIIRAIARRCRECRESITTSQSQLLQWMSVSGHDEDRSQGPRSNKKRLDPIEARRADGLQVYQVAQVRNQHDLAIDPRIYTAYFFDTNCDMREDRI